MCAGDGQIFYSQDLVKMARHQGATGKRRFLDPGPFAWHVPRYVLWRGLSDAPLAVGRIPCTRVRGVLWRVRCRAEPDPVFRVQFSSISLCFAAQSVWCASSVW
jgi:hypothetical protein